jgi:DNA-directed RNA polymerase subunit D
MKATIMEEEGNHFKVLFEEVSPDIVNAIRRTIMLDVPSLAIENVTIYDNTSALFDEIVAHRLGLLPLPTDLETLVFREDCACDDEGCPNCTVHYTVSKEGECTVYSGDIDAEDTTWATVDEKIPLLRLNKGQRIILEAEAILGTGKQHAKWQPASGIGYTYYPDISITDDCNGCRACIDICPRDVLGMKGGKAIIKNLEACSLCQSCVEECRRNAITVKGDPTRIIFTFESDGSLSPRAILTEALDILQYKYKALADSL